MLPTYGRYGTMNNIRGNIHTIMALALKIHLQGQVDILCE
jgi:hypothetical protein